MRTQATPPPGQPLPTEAEAPSFHELLGRFTDDDLPTDPADDDPLAFTPVPTGSTRHDGWTPERQARFLQALAVMGVVSRAACAVGMSKQSAHALRLRPGAETFASAWDCALAMGRDRAFEIAMDRAQNGVVAPRFYKGRQVGTVRRFDYRLALAAIDGLRAPRRAPSKKA